jgi:hypothetical protein
MDSQSAAVPVVVPVANAAVLPEISESLIGEPVSLGTVSESSPVVFSTDPAPAEALAASSVPAVHQEPERVPDPTLAIGFLAASANESTAPESTWPAPEFSSGSPAEAVPDSPFEAANSAPIAESEPFTPAFAPSFPQETSVSEASVETIVPETSAWNSPVDSPFQAAPSPQAPVFGSESPSFEPNPAYGNPPVEAFQPAPEVFSASAFQAAPENPVVPASQSSPDTAQPAVPDTDRVDDLLRQFRERYGRGSL